MVVKKQEKPVKAYNLTIEDYHTCYVSKNNVLVHNEGCGEPATVEELIDMMNKREGVDARFATGDAYDYLVYQNAEGSHMLLEDGSSSILLREDVATRWTAFHEWMHHLLQKKNGTYTPNEDDYIEHFLERHKEWLKIEKK